jgi:hypothetical protein
MRSTASEPVLHMHRKTLPCLRISSELRIYPRSSEFISLLMVEDLPHSCAAN